MKVDVAPQYKRGLPGDGASSAARRTRRARRISTWSVRAHATGQLVVAIDAPRARLAAEWAGRWLTEHGYAPVELEVVRRRVAGRGREPVDPMTLQAVHESAHAIVALALKIPVQYVTLIDEADDGSGGTCTVKAPRWLMRHLRGRPTTLRTRGLERRARARRAVLRNYAIQSLAGRVAEGFVVVRRPTRTDAPGSDWNDALVCARLLGHRGKAARAFLVAMEQEARGIVQANWGAVLALGRELLVRWERRRVGSWELAEIIASAQHSSRRSPGSSSGARGSRAASRARP